MKFTVILLFLFLFSPLAVNACSCAFSSPCSAFADTKAVFIGKMLGGTEKHTIKNEKGNSYIIESGKVRFQVQKVFKGNVSKQVTVDIASMKGTSCGTYGLKRGITYLVYGYGDKENTNNLYTGVCTRTNPIPNEYTKEDLKFLENLPPIGTGGNLTGSIWSDLKRGGATPFDKLKINVIDESGKVLTVFTNKEGDFELKRLKAGKYRVEPQLPEFFTIGKEIKEVEIVDRGCSSVGFEAEMTGKILGRMVDADDKPYNSIFLRLTFLENIDNSYTSIYGHSFGKNGEFDVEGVPPGKYVLYLELENNDYKKGQKRYFYPGTFNLKDAKILEVGLGGKIEGLKFILPDEYRVRTVKGNVTWADGTPASKVRVMLLCPQNIKKDGYKVEFSPPTTETNEQGNFELQGFTGESYWVEVRGEKDYEDKTVRVFHSPAKKIEIQNDISNLKLVLSENGFSAGCGEK
ncbi:MAG: hypothetical protein AAB336_05705 [Acidobacteriota bacterium]